MQLKMPVQPAWLRANVMSNGVGVDREAGIVRGVILAEEGIFKDRRGEFDRKAIKEIAKMAKGSRGGLKSRLGHPTLSSDGVGKLLGRMKNATTDTVLREGVDDEGKAITREVLVVRADLHLDRTALDEPIGGGKPIGIYVMDLAESDPDAFATSLVIKPKEDYRLDRQNRRMRDAAGNELPPLWYPEELHASDVVDTGDATNSFLATDLAGLPDAIVRQGTELLDAQFAGQDREVVQARLTAFVGRYILHRFGAAEELGTIDEPLERPAEISSTFTQAEPVAEPVAVGTADDALLLDLWLAQEAE